MHQQELDQAVTFSHPQLEEGKYYFPSESEEHEATWLQWPHQGISYIKDLEESWVQMARALCEG